VNRIRVTHTTTYRYAAPVTFGQHRLVVRPREGHDIQVELMVLAIQPKATVTWHRDLFGNSIANARFAESAELLEFRVEAIVLRGDQTSPHESLEALPVQYPVLYSALEAPVITGYLASVYSEEASQLREWVLSTFFPKNRTDAAVIVGEIGTWIHRTIEYRRREDRGVQSPLETLALKSGSCRDMATLLLEATRTLNIASRFATGYLDGNSSAAGIAATHAWTEVYFPEHGWYGWDPTLGEGTSGKHIVTGVSSHPRGVMPISGTYSGPTELYQGMTVSVKIEQLPWDEKAA